MTDRRQHDSRPDSERRIVPQNVKFGILALLICIAHILLAPSLARAADWEYSVRPGDTLIGLANRYLIDPEKWVDLQQLNAVKNPRKLQPNSILRIPVE